MEGEHVKLVTSEHRKGQEILTKLQMCSELGLLRAVRPAVENYHDLTSMVGAGERKHC